MVAELLNVLYVQTQGAYLHLEHDTVRVEVDHQTRARLPLLRLQGIVMFGAGVHQPVPYPPMCGGWSLGGLAYPVRTVCRTP